MTRRSGTRRLARCLGVGLSSASPASAACAPKDFDGTKFTVCTFDPRHEDIRLFWRGPTGSPYGSLGALADALKQKGERLAFAMNAGMFGRTSRRSDFMSRERQKLHGADTRGGGATNFHMKPNGVFWIGDGARA